jgi:hypothetical protein
LLACAAGSAGASALRVIPFPGTPDASTDTQIIFSALTRSDLSPVWVSGSRSGRHGGHLITLPDDGGVAFVPDHPFAPGELVRVRASLTSPSAGTASGDPGAAALSFSFTTAVPGRLADPPSPIRRPPAGQPRSARTLPPPGRTQSFVSAPKLTPPVVSVSSDPDPGAGDIFLTPRNGGITGGPMILDPQGRLVWFMPTPGASAFNLEIQHYLGQPVLTFWEGAVVDGSGHGYGVVMNNSYRTLATVHAGNGYSADLHEFQITPQGTALLDAYVPVQMDLSSVGGSPTGTVLDCVIQEVDVATGQVLWEWHSLDHIPLSESHSPIPRSNPYQYLHLNSIQQLPDGDLLISGRNTWAVYLISKQTGDVIWTLGGRQSSFAMGPGTSFEWQHDAQIDGDTVTLFNDADSPEVEHESVAKVLSLDTQNWTASLVQSDSHSPSLLTGSQGSAQTLPDGNLFVGWGAEPYFSEFSPAGEQIFDGHFPLGVASYRAYRFPWTGRPLTPPAAAFSRSSSGAVTVYASWNGATQVAAWCVRQVLTKSAFRRLRCTARTGFETAIRLASAPPRLDVRALASNGQVLGTSAPVVVSSPAGDRG